MSDRKAYAAAYFQAHKAEQYAFRRAHPEYGRRHYAKHREEILAQDRAQHAANPEIRRARWRAYREANPEANRNAWLKHRGCPREVYDALLAAQGDVCALCRQPESMTFKGTVVMLSVDHDHACCPGARSCGACIRGLLCNACNTGLGKFRDDPGLLRAAIDYLTRT